MLLPITLTMAAAAVVLHIWLATRCGRVRMRENISLGAGGNKLLLARMRAHLNFTENTPLFLLLLLLVELGGGYQFWLWIAGILFMLARVAHALGMDRLVPNRLRMLGTSVSFLLLLALAGYAIVLSYRAPHIIFS